MQRRVLRKPPCGAFEDGQKRGHLLRQHHEGGDGVGEKGASPATSRLIRDKIHIWGNCTGSTSRNGRGRGQLSRARGCMARPEGPPPQLALHRGLSGASPTPTALPSPLQRPPPRRFCSIGASCAASARTWCAHRGVVRHGGRHRDHSEYATLTWILASAGEALTQSSYNLQANSIQPRSQDAGMQRPSTQTHPYCSAAA